MRVAVLPERSPRPLAATLQILWFWYRAQPQCPPGLPAVVQVRAQELWARKPMRLKTNSNYMAAGVALGEQWPGERRVSLAPCGTDAGAALPAPGCGGVCVGLVVAATPKGAADKITRLHAICRRSQSPEIFINFPQNLRQKYARQCLNA